MIITLVSLCNHFYLIINKVFKRELKFSINSLHCLFHPWCQTDKDEIQMSCVFNGEKRDLKHEISFGNFKTIVVELSFQCIKVLKLKVGMFFQYPVKSRRPYTYGTSKHLLQIQHKKSNSSSFSYIN